MGAAFDAVQSCLTDRNPDIRQNAVEVFVSMVEPGNQNAIRLLQTMREEKQPFLVEMAIDEGLEILLGDIFPSGSEIERRQFEDGSLRGTVAHAETDSLGSFQFADMTSDGG